MKAVVCLVLALALNMGAPNRGHAEIREIVTMSQIVPEIDKDTLVVFDIDNTLLEPLQTLGSDQWFRYLVDEFQKEGADKNTAIAHAVTDWYQVNLKTAVRPVELTTPRLIQALQSHGIKTMALTSRPPRIATETFRQLASAGIDFSLQAPSNQNAKVVSDMTGYYLRGILFITPFGDKGHFLVDYLKQMKILPKKIVFIDDRPSNPQSVEAALANAPFPHVEFRYGFLDRKVARFDPRITDVEWKAFISSGKLMDDVTASRMVGAK